MGAAGRGERQPQRGMLRAPWPNRAGRLVPLADSRTAPAVGTVTADTPPSASPRSAVPAGTTSAPAGGTTGETRCPSQTLRLQVVAARASRSPSTTRSAARPRAWPSDSPRRRGPRRRLARPAAPQPPPPAPNVRPPRPGGQAPTFGVTGLAARPGSPRAAPRRPVLRPWPPCHGSRTVRPQPVREAWSTGDAPFHPVASPAAQARQLRPWPSDVDRPYVTPFRGGGPRFHPRCPAGVGRTAP